MTSAGSGCPPPAGRGHPAGGVRPADPGHAQNTGNGLFLTEPHPPGARVVGRYVHSYEPPARLPYPHPIPGMRPARETSPAGGQQSPTPIYDSLYAEYRRQFRALPGDRLGEEDLGFKPFGIGLREPRNTWERVLPPEPLRRHRRGVPRALPPAVPDHRAR